ncbi:hypothetical protein [Actinomadura sp. J1-007]|uniref:hypothetical protein n=1 Tax=Actinomadura sp. J1-007 TaxID=2661913 RepID=UPI0019D536BA|nr:hypothetical protein [Actinomadura sp. J1-007]
MVDRRRPDARLVVACEALAGDPGEPLARALRETLGLGADVRVLPPGTVPRVEVGKAVRVVTWDSGEPPLPGLG